MAPSARTIFRRRQLFFQQPRRTLLDEQLALKVEPGGKAEIRVGRPCEAIYATVFAAAIGVDGPVERDVRGLVAGNNRPGFLHHNFGFQGLQYLPAFPPVVEILTPKGFEAAGRVRRGTPPAPHIDRGESVAKTDAELSGNLDALGVVNQPG